MLIRSEQEMLDFGKKIGEELDSSVVFELLGDVGAGKTTLTRGIAEGLGIEEDVTSPSFTISKEYQGKKLRLVHFDFYRLEDPGIMADDLAEEISAPDTVVIVEWGQSVAELLPESHRTIEVKYIDESTREVNEL
ncbi:MAG: tRNA (adenosine(37)-N6)-threonylcarbamoyltransferase complex ATPase subunit type 1 TsaE [Candidatus Saccharibacteria bacterium]|nr:tRNA (adenosine(37)-N6)-threonylcarbamoyltransferase complex ATPase subunit type 1 TsaE [Candidatus Saccharibacteria bacterium]